MNLSENPHPQANPDRQHTMDPHEAAAIQKSIERRKSPLQKLREQRRKLMESGLPTQEEGN